MAEFTEALTDGHVEMIGKQPIFFVSTAAADGRINLSPKGLDCFRVLGPRQVGTSISAARATRRMRIWLPTAASPSCSATSSSLRLSCASTAGDDRCCRKTRAGRRWRRSSHCCPAPARSS